MPRKPELVGQRFGSLTVIGELPERDRRGNVRWLCECECGKEKIATSGDLHVGKAFHCGCSGANTLKNKGMIGKKFHRLLVVEKASPDGDQTCWKCKCDCGKTVTIRSGNLKNGNSQSCGCWRSIANTTHGKSDAPEYGTWSGIKGRCNNPHNSSYRYYGGRGIKICDRNLAYRWLADKLGMSEESSHIGNLNAPTCKDVVRFCKGMTGQAVVDWCDAKDNDLSPEQKLLKAKGIIVPSLEERLKAGKQYGNPAPVPKPPDSRFGVVSNATEEDIRALGKHIRETRKKKEREDDKPGYKAALTGFNLGSLFEKAMKEKEKES